MSAHLVMSAALAQLSPGWYRPGRTQAHPLSISERPLTVSVTHGTPARASRARLASSRDGSIGGRRERYSGADRRISHSGSQHPGTSATWGWRAPAVIPDPFLPGRLAHREKVSGIRAVRLVQRGSADGQWRALAAKDRSAVGADELSIVRHSRAWLASPAHRTGCDGRIVQGVANRALPLATSSPSCAAR
jgi:hypothetical protein